MIKKWKAYVDSQSSEDMYAKGTPTQAGVMVPRTVLLKKISLFEGMKTAIFQKEVMFCVQN
jgi:hypothetical protein